MFRNLSKFSVKKYLRYSQICSRNVCHSSNSQGIFPGILRKSLIQVWRPAFTDSVNLPGQYNNVNKELVIVDLEKKPAFVRPILQTLKNYFQKTRVPENLKAKKFKLTFNTAGRFRKFIGDFQRAYFRTDRVLCSSCKSGKDKDPCKGQKKARKETCKESGEKVDPCAAKKQRKSPKKELGGRCPFIKEECLNRGGKKQGTCKKVGKPICGNEKDKKGRCRKAVACKKKSGGTCSKKAGPKTKKKNADESCAAKLAAKSKKKSADKKPTCPNPEEEDPCAKKKDTCGSKKSSSDVCAKEKDPCSSTKSASSGSCAKKKDTCGSKTKSSCDTSKSKKCASKPCGKKKGGSDKKPTCSSSKKADPCDSGKSKKKPTCPSRGDGDKKKKESCASLAAKSKSCGESKDECKSKEVEDPCGTASNKSGDACEKQSEDSCKKPPKNACKKASKDSCGEQKISCKKTAKNSCKKQQQDCSQTDSDPCKVCESLPPKEKKKCERERKYWMMKKAVWEKKWIKCKKNK